MQVTNVLGDAVVAGIELYQVEHLLDRINFHYSILIISETDGINEIYKNNYKFGVVKLCFWESL